MLLLLITTLILNIDFELCLHDIIASSEEYYVPSVILLLRCPTLVEHQYDMQLRKSVLEARIVLVAT